MRKPKYGWSYVVDKTLAYGLIGLAVMNLAVGDSDAATVYIAFSAACAAHARLEALSYDLRQVEQALKDERERQHH